MKALLMAITLAAALVCADLAAAQTTIIVDQYGRVVKVYPRYPTAGSARGRQAVPMPGEIRVGVRKYPAAGSARGRGAVQ